MNCDASAIEAVTTTRKTIVAFCANGFTNVAVEIGNEIDLRHYDHPIIKPDRCAELIRLVQQASVGRVESRLGRLLVGTSFSGGAVPSETVTAESDVLLIHGNGRDSGALVDLIEKTRGLSEYRGQPIVVNEDDHFDFEREDCNFLTALNHGVSWGYFDYRMEGESFREGYQSVPTDWTISSTRKRGFFNLVAEMTGSEKRF